MVGVEACRVVDQTARELRSLARIGLTVLIISLAGYILWPALLRLPQMDENLFIYEGWITALGKVPYRDFFEFIGPLTFWLTALVIKLGGLSIAALRIESLFLLVASALFTWKIGARYLPHPWLIWLCVFLWFVLIPGRLQVQHHLISSFFGLWSVSRLFDGISKEPERLLDSRAIPETALLLSLTLLTTQSLGGLLLGAIALFLIAYGRLGLQLSWRALAQKLIRNLALPIVLPIGAVMFYFGSQGALDDYIYSTVTWLWEGGYAKLTSHHYLGEGFLKLFIIDIWQQVLMLMLGWLPVLGLLWGAETLIRQAIQLKASTGFALEESPNPAPQKFWRLLLLWAGAAAFFAGTFSFPTSVLIAAHGWLPYLLAIMAIYNSGLRHRPRWLMTLLVLSGIWFAGLLWMQIQVARFMHESEERLISYGTVEKELFSPSYYSATDTKIINAITYWIHTHTPEDQPLYAYNISPEFYFLTNRHNPTRYQYIMHLYNTPAQLEEAGRSLGKALPPFVLYDQIDRQFFTKDYRFQPYWGTDYRIQPVERVIQQHYRLKRDFGTLQLYERTRS